MTMKTGLNKATDKKSKDLVALLSSSHEEQFDIHHKSIFGSDAGFCDKKSALHLAVKKGTMQDVSQTSKWFFKIGDVFHDLVDQGLRDVIVANELSIYHPLGVNGRIDNIIWNSKGSQLEIVDTKTCGKLPSKIKAGHLEQLATYCLISGIPKGGILYVSRSVSDWRGNLLARYIELDFDLIKDKIAKTIVSSFIWKTEELIPIDNPRPNKSSCKWCPFIPYCWEDKEFDLDMNENWMFTHLNLPLEARIEKAKERLLDDMPNAYDRTKNLIAKFGSPLGKRLIVDGLI